MRFRRIFTFGFLVPLVTALTAAPVTDPASEVTDGAGRRVTLPARVSRIVSLAPSVTEILFAVGAGERIVGVTDFCDYPPDALDIPRIGGLINPDLERIIDLSPDLVVASTAGNYLDDTERIDRLGVPVYAIDTPTIASILATIERVGELLGDPEAARTVAADLSRRIAAVTASRPPLHPRTMFVIEPEPLIAPGRETFVGEALEIAGGIVVGEGSASRWAQYDMEQVIRMKPELILTSEIHAEWAKRLAGSAGWELVPAVARGHVFVISDALQHPGPRLMDGIEEVAAIIDGVARSRDDDAAR